MFRVNFLYFHFISCALKILWHVFSGFFCIVKTGSKFICSTKYSNEFEKKVWNEWPLYRWNDNIFLASWVSVFFSLICFKINTMSTATQIQTMKRFKMKNWLSTWIFFVIDYIFSILIICINWTHSMYLVDQTQLLHSHSKQSQWQNELMKSDI